MNESSNKPEWAKTNADLRREKGEKPSKVRRIVIPAIIVLAVAAGIIFLLKPTSDADSMSAETSQTKDDIKYIAQEEVATVQPATLKKQIKVTGSIEPLNTSQLPALISAQILKVYARPGEAVKKGQLLVEMDTEDLVIQKEQQLSSVAATEAQLALAESQLKRTKEMSAQGISTSSQLEEAASTVDAQKANLQAQRSQVKSTDYQLRNANIYSPINGIVSERSSDAGQYVNTGSPLMTVVDLSVMELVVNISTADSTKIKTGMKVNLTVEGLTNQQFTGTISRISPITRTGTRTVPVYILIDNTVQMLRGGMFAVGHIVLQEKSDSIAIDSEAVRLDENNTPYVFKIVDNIIVKQPVELGERWGENQAVEVISGLVQGDKIIILPMLGLQAGDAINLIED